MGNIVDAKGNPVNESKQEAIVEKIPEKMLNPIMETQNKMNKKRQTFFQLSLRLAQIQQKVQETLSDWQKIEQSFNSKVERAYNKMKLDKKKNLVWTYDGKGNFIGKPRPVKKNL